MATPAGHANRPSTAIPSVPALPFLDIPTHNLSKSDQLVEDAGRELGEDVVSEIPFHSEAKQATNHHDPHTRSRSQPGRMVVVVVMMLSLIHI